MAGEAPRESLAYVALPTVGHNGLRDALGVVDTDPASPDYGRLVSKLQLPQGGNELHHFGWNACSSHWGELAGGPTDTNRCGDLDGARRRNRSHRVWRSLHLAERQRFRRARADTGTCRRHTS
jgi:hypothetical protein